MKPYKKEFTADTQTAGCIGLLAQVALPVALYIPSDEPITLILKGGTNVPMGPHIEYLSEVFRPYLNKFGANFDFTLLKRYVKKEFPFFTAKKLSFSGKLLNEVKSFIPKIKQFVFSLSLIISYS